MILNGSKPYQVRKEVNPLVYSYVILNDSKPTKGYVILNGSKPKKVNTRKKSGIYTYVILNNSKPDKWRYFV